VRALSKIPNLSSKSDPLESGLASLSVETGVFGGVAKTGYVSDDCTSLGDDGDGDDSEDDPLASKGRCAAQTGDCRFRNPRRSSGKLLPGARVCCQESARATAAN
jgi:hypothetical protein